MNLQDRNTSAIGFGSFVKANLVNTDTIVVGVGAGVSVEKISMMQSHSLKKEKTNLQNTRNN